MRMNNAKKPRQRFGKVFTNCFRMIFKVARVAPLYFVGVVISGLTWGAMGSAEAIFTLNLFNALDAGAPFSEIAGIILLMAVVYTVVYSTDAWYWEYFWQIQRKKMEFRLHEELFVKTKAMDIACYDDPEFYNDFTWSMQGIGNDVADLMRDFGMIINRIVSGTTLFTLLFSIDTGVAIVLLVTSVLSIVINQISNKLHFEQQKEIKPLDRVRDYLNRIFHLPEYAKEIRISRVEEVLMQTMDENTERTVDVTVKYGKKFFFLHGLCSTLLNQGVYYGILLFMFSKLLSGEVLIGAFAATVGMIWRVRGILRTFVEHITKFPKHSLYLEKYYGFLAYEPKTVSGEREVPAFESLELREVAFTYDFSDNPRYRFRDTGQDAKKVSGGSVEALRGVNMSLKRGEKIAIVGYNGAGKTTLIKLLMRLYDPTEGQILLNGVDVREYKMEEYRNRIGTVFQDFRIFAASVAENVVNGIYDEASDRETVLTALNAAGFTERLSKMENGIDTLLTREFDDKGINLSGGESQKIAIARVFAKPFELIIMDEPSSALDPVAEYELNQAILRYAADKTVIFISHRLSTTRMADRIYMFAQGELVEVGSHEELMARGGKYAEMFNLQAEKYMTE